jgi:putative ABC transport system permease protein
VTGAWCLALRNLRRHRRRNAVTGLAVAVGYAGLVVLLGYSEWAQQELRTGVVYLQHRGHLAVYAPGGLKRAEAKPGQYALPAAAQESIVAALRADPRVVHVGRTLLGSGIAGNGCRSFQMRLVGVEPELERQLRDAPERVRIWGRGGAGPVAGRAVWDAPGIDAPVVLAPVLARSLEKERAFAPPPAAGASSAVAASLGPPPPAAEGPAAVDCAAADAPVRLGADPFVQLGARTADGSFGAVDGRVVGVFRPASTEESKTAVLAPLALAQRLYDTDRVSYVAGYLRDHRDAPAVERDLVARLRAEGVDVSVHRYDDAAANPYYAGTVAFTHAMVFFIVVLVTNVVAFSVLNAMTLAAIERARELGTLRSLGFTRGDLEALFLREAALLTALALAAGALLAAAARAAVAAAGIRFVPPGAGTDVLLQLLPTPAAYLGTAAFFLLVTVSTTWVAVRRKARERVALLLAEVAA